MGQEIFNLFRLQSFLVRNYSTDYVGEDSKKDIIFNLGNETSIHSREDSAGTKVKGKLRDGILKSNGRAYISVPVLECYFFLLR